MSSTKANPRPPGGGQWFELVRGLEYAAAGGSVSEIETHISNIHNHSPDESNAAAQHALNRAVQNKRWAGVSYIADYLDNTALSGGEFVQTDGGESVRTGGEESVRTGGEESVRTGGSFNLASEVVPIAPLELVSPFDITRLVVSQPASGCGLPNDALGDRTQTYRGGLSLAIAKAYKERYGDGCQRLAYGR